MKIGSREYRGSGGTMFGDIINHDETPSNFQKDFIKSSLNKDTLYQCLVERFSDLHYSTTLTLAVTCKDEILKTQDASDEDINSYKYEEVDACVVRHFISKSKCCLTLFLFIHMIQMFCYFVWLIIIFVNSKVHHVLFSVRLARILVRRSTM